MFSFGRPGPLLGIHLGLLQALILAASLVVLESAHLLHRRFGLRDFYNRIPGLARFAFFLSAVVWIVIGGRFDSQSFLYFQF
jgi:hypothetical protein